MARSDSPDQPGKPAKPAKPKKTRWYTQLRQIYSNAKTTDPKLGWWMLGAFLLVLAIGLGIGALFDKVIYFAFLSVPLAFLAAVIVLSRRAEASAYRQIEGQPGAAGAALSSIRRGWYLEQQPVAAEVARGADMSHAAIVFRALGRPGVVLVAEGPEARARKLLLAEKKKVERVAPGVPVTTLRVGTGEGDDMVPIRKLASKVQRMKPVLTKAEVAVVNKRLKSIGGVRPPMPAGVDPTKMRMDRRAMRGR